jgi:hypothetical protein
MRPRHPTAPRSGPAPKCSASAPAPAVGNGATDHTHQARGGAGQQRRLTGLAGLGAAAAQRRSGGWCRGRRPGGHRRVRSCAGPRRTGVRRQAGPPGRVIDRTLGPSGGPGRRGWQGPAVDAAGIDRCAEAVLLEGYKRERDRSQAKDTDHDREQRVTGAHRRQIDRRHVGLTRAGLGARASTGGSASYTPGLRQRAPGGSGSGSPADAPGGRIGGRGDPTDHR